MTANGENRFGVEYANRLQGISVKQTLVSKRDPNHYPLLEPPETTLPTPSDYSYRARFLAGNEKEMSATREAYAVLNGSPSSTHLVNLDTCRKFAKFAREKSSGDVKVMSSACRDRWCPMCAKEKAAFAKEQTELYVKSLTAPRFLTLTLRNDIGDLKTQLEFLQDCFRRIRLRAFWKKNVTGGIWFLQVKRGHNSGCWHPHFHILLDGNYMEQRELSDLWHLITHGSFVIDIRKIHNVEAAAKYVSRYTARPAMLESMSIDDRVEIIESLAGKRLCGTFGNAKVVTLTPPKIESDGEWQDVGYYDQIVNSADRSPAAKAVIDAYRLNQPLSESAFYLYTGHTVNYVSKIEPRKLSVQLLLDFYNTS